VAQSYWATGAPSQLSGSIGVPTVNYGVDGEGRTSAVSASSGQNPVTVVTFNAGSLPTQVNFGSGDTDIFAYDSNTLRMTQFKFNVGAQPQTYIGALTWNANSTLGQLAITDPFNGADTQTCTYAHDDLTRIAGANCGAAAAQTFSYDPFGNISKSGSPYSFQPTYSPSTNRMTSLPGFTPSYDANGNLLNDNSHAYTWDADGNSVTVDGVGLTYDALDRMVEQNRSGSYAQIVYAPTGGKLALMSGQSLLKAFIPLPGQATAVYTSSGLDHYRHSDWLGSARLTSSPSQAYLSSVAYAPFGETYAQSGTADLSFTGQNQDTVSGDYDFLFREYSMQGRWASPDPVGLAAVDRSNPQSWNRYAYVLDNPLIYVDLAGLIWACTTVLGVEQCVYYPDDADVSNYGGFDGGDGSGLLLRQPLLDTGPDRGGGYLDIKSLQDAAARNQERKALAACQAAANAAYNAETSPLPNASSILSGALGAFYNYVVRGATVGSAASGFAVGFFARPVANANLRALAYANTYNACVARVSGGPMVINPGP